MNGGLWADVRAISCAPVQYTIHSTQNQCVWHGSWLFRENLVTRSCRRVGGQPAFLSKQGSRGPASRIEHYGCWRRPAGRCRLALAGIVLVGVVLTKVASRNIDSYFSWRPQNALVALGVVGNRLVFRRHGRDVDHCVLLHHGAPVLLSGFNGNGAFGRLLALRPSWANGSAGPA